MAGSRVVRGCRHVLSRQTIPRLLRRKKARLGYFAPTRIIRMLALLPLLQSLVPFLEDFLPTKRTHRPFVTLTWAQSLDSRIAAQPGVQTKISHPETKTMTHYLRANHDAILVGVGTVLADDPKLNCRYGDTQIRPVVVDPHAKWSYRSSSLSAVCKEGKGLAPYIFIDTRTQPSRDEVDFLLQQGGRFIPVDLTADRVQNWRTILHALHLAGIASVMVEGGADVINSMLESGLVDSVIITIGPVFLGKNGVEVSPHVATSLDNVKWWTGISDGVMAGTLRQKN